MYKARGRDYKVFFAEENRMQEAKSAYKRAYCGTLVGGANSLFGGGGGMLAVPLLNGLGYEEKQSHATAILVILPVSFLSFLLYEWCNNQW